MDFMPFPKIARLSREVVVTEKIDGTNAQVAISEPGVIPTEGGLVTASVETPSGPVALYAGSRSRWITPGKSTDNFGFAGWVKENAASLVMLGAGHHFGEWWGSGIQRGYGLSEKRFSLFNVSRWGDDAVRPACCGIVPVLYEGPFSTEAVEDAIWALRAHGSLASPGFGNPEGVIVFHTASRALFKKTLEKDDEPKSLAA